MNREKALEEYYKNPSVCKNCGEILIVPEGGRIYDTKRKKFCNSSCAASFNNKGKIKNPNGLNGLKLDKSVSEREICPQCGGKKDRSSDLCAICYKEEISVSNKTLGYFISGQKYLSTKLTQVRKDARRVMSNSSKEKMCHLCNNHTFDEILEVHHIKGILEFSEETLISEINNEENLM